MWWNRNRYKLPIQEDNGLYYIESHLKNSPCGFILDTGSTKNKICQSVAQKLCLPSSRVQVKEMIADGSISFYETDVLTIPLFAEKDFLLEFLVCPDDKIPSEKPEVVGLLWVPFLKYCIFDFQKQELEYILPDRFL